MGCSPYSRSVALRRPPHGYETDSSAAIESADTTDALSTAQIGLFTRPKAFLLVRFEVVPGSTPPSDPRTAIGFVRFGHSEMEAATINDWPFTHAEIWEWLAIAPYDNYLTMIRAGSVNVRVRWYATDTQVP